MAGEILGGDLLHAGGGEKGDGDRGEKRGDEEGEDEGAAGGRGFNHGGHREHGAGYKETCAAVF